MFGAFKGFNRMKVLAFVFITCIAVAMIGCIEYYAAEPIVGQVVEVATNEPIPGANIVVLWEITTGSHDHGEGLIEVKEAVTDAQGRYRIEGWGPVRNPWPGKMRAYQPIMFVFHPSFYPSILQNVDPVGPIQMGWAPQLAAMPFYWNGRVITLERALDKSRIYRQLEMVQSAAMFLYKPQRCEWVNAVHFLNAVEQFRLRAYEHGFEPSQFRTLDNVRLSSSCGDVELILGEKK